MTYSLPSERDFGTIEVGNKADLLLVEGNSTENLGEMAAGRWNSCDMVKDMI